MGRRGPNPKPAPLRAIEGNRGKRRIPNEPQAEPGPCEAPAHMIAEARAVWDRLAPELESMGLLAPRYMEAFEVFCNATVAYRRAAVLVARAGPVIERDGQVVSNPASREFARYASLMRAFGSDFGLTPAAVTAIAHGESYQPAVSTGDPRRLLSLS
jgi:P27 family predicted phage terminase small subunit